MAANIQLLSALGSYFTYDVNDPTGQGNGGNQIVLTFDHELDIASSSLTAAQIQVSWNAITSTPTAISFLKRSSSSTTANQILLSWSTQQNPFAVPYFKKGVVGVVPISGVSIPAGALVATNGDTNPAIHISSALANGTPTSPAALPVLYGFTVDSTLASYLGLLGYATAANNIFVSVASGQGVSLWPDLAIPNGSAFTQGQVGGGSAGAIVLAQNYALSSLTSAMPLGGSIPQAWGLNTSLTKPWLSANLLQSARFYVSVPTTSTTPGLGQIPWNQANLASTPTYQNVTSDPLGPSNTSGIGWQFFETYAAIQPGASAFYSNYNYDTSYVDGFEVPISVNVRDPAGNVIKGQSIDGGASRGQSVYAALNSKSATLNPTLQRASGQPTRLLAPSQTAQLAGVYHDFSGYLQYLGANGITASIVRKGDGGNTFNYTARFFNDASGAPAYIVLQNNTTPQTIYLPYALANAPTGVTLSTKFVFTAVVPDPSQPITSQTYQGNGLYGGNTGYFIYNGDPAGGDYGNPSSIFAIGAPSQQPNITNDSIGVAVGDVLFGLNYGMIGSTVSFQGTAIGAMPSDQWFGADNLTASSPVLAGYWGPWAWGNNATQVQNNEFWNTWLFAMNGYVAPNPSDYTAGGNPLTVGSQQLSQVYGWAFADRVAGSAEGGADQAKLLNFGPIGQANGSASQALPPFAARADPTILPTGYLEIILGAPGSPDGPPSTITLRQLGFSASATRGEVTGATANLSTNAFFSPFQAGINPDRSLGTFDAGDPTRLAPLINRASSRALGSIDSSFGARLAGLPDSAAIAQAVKGTEGRSIGAGNTGVGRLASGSFGTYDTTTTTTYRSTTSQDVTVDLSTRGLLTSVFTQGSADLALYTGIFEINDSTGGVATHTVQVEAANVSAKANGLVPYRVDAITGIVNGVLPGESGYLQQALANRLTSSDFLLASNTNGSFSFTVDDGQDFAFLLVSGGTSSDLLSRNPANARGPGNPLGFFSIGGANPDGSAHMLALGSNTYGFEDLWGGGDFDFNDLVLSVRV